jgi:hypothetical protein
MQHFIPRYSGLNLTNGLICLLIAGCSEPQSHYFTREIDPAGFTCEQLKDFAFEVMLQRQMYNDQSAVKLTKGSELSAELVGNAYSRPLRAENVLKIFAATDFSDEVYKSCTDMKPGTRERENPNGH